MDQFQQTDQEVGFDNTAQTQPQSTDKKHPIAVFFHIFWKAVAIALYLCLAYFLDNYVVTVVVVLIILAADFWTVKNVTGRLLARMRYVTFTIDQKNCVLIL